MNLRTIFISSFLSLSSLGVLAQEQINLSGYMAVCICRQSKGGGPFGKVLYA